MDATRRFLTSMGLPAEPVIQDGTFQSLLAGRARSTRKYCRPQKGFRKNNDSYSHR